MTDNKLTDNEIIKALEQKIKFKEFDESEDAIIKVNILKNVLDLINCLQEVNEQLKQDIDILQGAVDTGNAVCEQCEQKHKAEINGLREDYTRACTERDLRIITHDFIKTEAYKEFAEKLKNEIISDTAYGCDTNQHTGYYDYQIKIGDIPEYIDNLLKELVGEDK